MLGASFGPRELLESLKIDPDALIRKIKANEPLLPDEQTFLDAGHAKLMEYVRLAKGCNKEACQRDRGPTLTLIPTLTSTLTPTLA